MRCRAGDGVLEGVGTVTEATEDPLEAAADDELSAAAAAGGVSLGSAGRSAGAPTPTPPPI